MNEKDYKNLYTFSFLSILSVFALFAWHILVFTIPGVVILLPLWAPMVLVHIVLIVDFLNNYTV
jgi:hypothetical protein